MRILVHVPLSTVTSGRPKLTSLARMRILVHVPFSVVQDVLNLVVVEFFG
jgi:hypothetical protein